MSDTRRPLDIDRAAWLLIRKYGDCCAIEAYRRSQRCADCGDAKSAREWNLVLQKVVDLHFRPPAGPLN